jgi:hypothetical protein
MSNAPLQWTTIINGIKKTATTHFGTVYTIEKIESLGGWVAKVTVPAVRRGMGGTETLIHGVTFAQARKAAIDDYTKNGGR